MSSTIVGTMFIACRRCGQIRTLRVCLYTRSIRNAMDRPCWDCTHLAAQSLADEITHLDLSPELAAKRLGTTVTAIARRFYRAGMHEQARPFERIARGDRKRKKAA